MAISGNEKAPVAPPIETAPSNQETLRAQYDGILDKLTRRLSTSTKEEEMQTSDTIKKIEELKVRASSQDMYVSLKSSLSEAQKKVVANVDPSVGEKIGVAAKKAGETASSALHAAQEKASGAVEDIKRRAASGDVQATAEAAKKKASEIAGAAMGSKIMLAFNTAFEKNGG